MRVIYNQHLFAHYRQAIIDKMLHYNNHDFFFAGDTVDPYNSGIKGAVIDDPTRFVHLRCPVAHKALLLQLGFGRLIGKLRPDCVIFPGCYQFVHVWFYAVVLRLLGVRVLFWTHGWTRPATGAKGLIRNAFYRLADGLLLYGNRSKAFGVSYGFDPRSLYVIYNSLDYEKQSRIRDKVRRSDLLETRRRLFGDTDTPVVICCARLVFDRGLDLLLESLRLLRSDGHHVHCLLVGDGPAREQLADVSKRYGLSVHFYGACYDEEVLANLFMISNVCVSPGFVGLTAIHSLTYGVPVVTHDNLNANMPECECISDGETGSLFHQYASEDLAVHIRQWTSQSWVDAAVATACHHVVARFYNAGHQIKVIEQALNDIPAKDTAWVRWRGSL